MESDSASSIGSSQAPIYDSEGSEYKPDNSLEDVPNEIDKQCENRIANTLSNWSPNTIREMLDFDPFEVYPLYFLEHQINELPEIELSNGNSTSTSDSIDWSALVESDSAVDAEKAMSKSGSEYEAEEEQSVSSEEDVTLQDEGREQSVSNTTSKSKQGGGKNLGLLPRTEVGVMPPKVPQERVARKTSKPSDRTLNRELVETAIPREFIMEEDLASKFGLDGCELVRSEVTDRAYHSNKGLCLYWKSYQWGVRFPLSNFVRELLIKLNVAPVQIHSVAWCHINSFDDFIREDPDSFGEGSEASLNLFMEYYDFALAGRSNSWISVRKRQNSPFEVIEKILDWQYYFFYVKDSDRLRELLGGVRLDWNWKPTFPGRQDFTDMEGELKSAIEHHHLGCMTFFQNFNFL